MNISNLIWTLFYSMTRKQVNSIPFKFNSFHFIIFFFFTNIVVLTSFVKLKHSTLELMILKNDFL